MVNVWDLYKNSALPQQYLDLIHIYGRNKKEWKRVLMKEIDKDQLSPFLGGSNPEGLDYGELRNSGDTYRCYANREN
jgi:hypothetical protein